MRLLEFNRDEGGANPQHSRAPRAKRPAVAARPHRQPVNEPRSTHSPPGEPNAGNGSYPMQGNAVRKLVQRPPIDLEQLQQRIGFLERRLQDQSHQSERLATRKDLDLLRERMNQLEHSLEQELANAHTREDRLLEALDRPPLKILLKLRAVRFWSEDLPRIAAWLLKTARNVWQEIQPEWWPALAHAWKESLEKARR